MKKDDWLGIYCMVGTIILLILLHPSILPYLN